MSNYSFVCFYTDRRSSAGGSGSRRGSSQLLPAATTDAGSTCGSEAGDATPDSAGAVRIADYVTSRAFNRATLNGAAGCRKDDDADDAEGEAGDDEAENSQPPEQARHRHQRRQRGHGADGPLSASGANKPRTSDYESSDSPNSSDHCEELTAPSASLLRYDDAVATERPPPAQSAAISAQLEPAGEDPERPAKLHDEAADVVVIVDTVTVDHVA